MTRVKTKHSICNGDNAEHGVCVFFSVPLSPAINMRGALKIER